MGQTTNPVTTAYPERKKQHRNTNK